MPIRTNEFQRLIAVIQSHLDPGSTVTESAMLTDAVTDSQREVDVAVSGRVGGQAVTVSIECRDRSRGPDVGRRDANETFAVANECLSSRFPQELHTGGQARCWRLPHTVSRPRRRRPNGSRQ